MSSDHYPNPPNPGLDPNANISGPLNAIIIVTIIFTFLALTLRLVARRLGRNPLWVDDYLIVIAVCFVWALCGVLLYLTHNLYLGQHIAKATTEQFTQYMKISYFLCFVLQFAYSLMKLSVLAFYWRIFKDSNIRWPLIITFSLVFTWMIAYTFVNVFWCIPVQAYWEIGLQANPDTKCQVWLSEFLGNTITDLVLDATLLILPLFAIANLQLLMPRKLALSGIFLLGVFSGTTLSCAMRLYQNHKSLSIPGFDTTYTSTNICIWALVEAGLGVFTACLPTLGPFVKLVRYGSARTKTLSFVPSSNEQSFKANRRPPRVGPNGSAPDPDDWIMLDGHEHAQDSKTSLSPAPETSEAIPVKTEVDVADQRV